MKCARYTDLMLKTSIPVIAAFALVGACSSDPAREGRSHIVANRPLGASTPGGLASKPAWPPDFVAENRPLGEVLADLAMRVMSKHKVGLEVEWEDLSAAGVTPERPVTVRVDGPSLGRVLKAIGTQVGEDRFRYGEVTPHRVVVTSARGFIVRYGVIREYDMSDRVPDGDDQLMGELANLVTECVDPDSWAGAARPASARPAPEPTTAYVRWSGRRMTVRQTPENHRQIAGLLEQVREAGDALEVPVHGPAAGR